LSFLGSGFTLLLRGCLSLDEADFM
jgi:hypothetical protein